MAIYLLRRIPMGRLKLAGVSALALVSLMFSGCTSMLLVQSTWNAGQVKINGKSDDWGDTMFYIPDAQMTAGVRNDGKYLYLILKSTDRRQSIQILGLGLTVWFNPSGGSGRAFGIHFPMGRVADRGEFRRSGNQGMQMFTDTSEMNQGFAMRMPNEVELFGVDSNGPVRLSVAELKGIELQLHTDREGLVYELRVPLHSSPDEPYAINANGPQIGIGFVGGKFQMPTMRRDRQFNGGGMGEGGGYPGEGGGYPGGYGGEGYPGEGGGGYGPEGGHNMQRRQFPQPKQINFWLKVDLASK